MKWRTVQEAQEQLANFESVQQLPKYVMRPVLALSQTVDVRPLFEAALGSLQLRTHACATSPWDAAPPPAGELQVVEVDDVRGCGGIMTDGCGYISSDLAAHLPTISSGRARGQQNAAADGAPLAVQLRLWYLGSRHPAHQKKN